MLRANNHFLTNEIVRLKQQGHGMSSNNGVIRVGRKGIKKFAFGEEGQPFEVDVVAAFQEWVAIDESFRGESGNDPIRTEDMYLYHQAAVEFVERLAGVTSEHAKEQRLTTAESLDFIARLREQYDELAAFFRPRSRSKQDSPVSSEPELRFSVEGES